MARPKTIINQRVVVMKQNVTFKTRLMGTTLWTRKVKAGDLGLITTTIPPVRDRRMSVSFQKWNAQYDKWNATSYEVLWDDLGEL